MQIFCVVAINLKHIKARNILLSLVDLKSPEKYKSREDSSVSRLNPLPERRKAIKSSTKPLLGLYDTLISCYVQISVMRKLLRCEVKTLFQSKVNSACK